MGDRKEFRISLTNAPGQLARVGEALGSRGVNILTIAAMGADSSVIVLVTDQEDKAREALGELGLSFQEAELLTTGIPHQPGTLGALAKKMADANINIESIYLLGASVEEVKLAFTVSDPGKAKEILGQ
jgi:hypothetical protein